MNKRHDFLRHYQWRRSRQQFQRLLASGITLCLVAVSLTLNNDTPTIAKSKPPLVAEVTAAKPEIRTVQTANEAEDKPEPIEINTKDTPQVEDKCSNLNFLQPEVLAIYLGSRTSNSAAIHHQGLFRKLYIHDFINEEWQLVALTSQSLTWRSNQTQCELSQSLSVAQPFQ
ncbi:MULTISPECIES: hypothetical protein [Gammaproteobacteria]|uniref:hypothetical protein n=1 Tax=Gammaproteobacteria TaxID=1236 RepID=UPI000DCFD449|nr:MULTISPECIES: hypothetical protein [Gammaproteobacteria]RTE85917.1 hypothetical protein DQX04_10760 [Aliidiomarina sp. B3213]TCZ90084.1 hypothetical protein EYQ95_09705 [Lysobacter sp. N42]